MDFADLFKALIGLGTGGILAGVFAYLWWRADGKVDKLTEKFVTSVESSNTSRVDLATALNRLADKIGAKG